MKLNEFSGPRKNKPVVAEDSKLKEATGDEKFDRIMNNISGSDSPSVDLNAWKTIPDKEIMELTHKIFLRLRDFDDPRIYQKFINFMIKTINTNVGPIDESLLVVEKDEGKHNNGKTTGFKVVAAKAAKEYGSKEAGQRVAGAIRNKMKKG